MLTKMANRNRRDPNGHGLAAQIEFMELTMEIIRTPMSESILTSLKELNGIKKNRVEELKRDSNRF